MSKIFAFTSYWSWGTFILYVSIACIVIIHVKNCGSRISALAAKAPDNRRYVIRIDYNIIFAFVILVLLASLRTMNVGPDTDNYVYDFINATTYRYDWSRFFEFRQVEPGFQLYECLIRSFTDNYTIYFFITYSIIASAYLRFMKYYFTKCKAYTVFIVFIYYYVLNMSGMRSAMGSVFIIHSFILLDKKNYFKAILLTIAGMMFHYTMIYNFYIICVLFIFSKEKLRSRKWLWVVLLLFAVVATNFGLSRLTNALLDTKYNMINYQGFSSITGSLIYIALGIISLFLYKPIIDEEDSSKKTSLLITMAFLLTYPMIYRIGAYRITNYYILPRLVVWSKMDEFITNRMHTSSSKSFYQMIAWIICILYLLMLFTRSSSNGNFVYQLRLFQ